MMYIHVMAYRGFCTHYFVQSLRWSYEVGCINTVDHLLLLEISSILAFMTFSLSNVSPTSVSLSLSLVYLSSLLHVGGSRAWLTFSIYTLP